MMYKECENPDKICFQKKLGLLTPKGIVRLVDIHDIVYINAERSYCKVNLNDGDEIVVSKPLKRFESKLCEGKFIRCHRSYIVNKIYLVGFSKSAKSIKLMNGDELPCSEQVLKELIEEVML
ncbi:LytTR family DNA-binding domain-containing protein [Carboxylicivirga sp. M1479]|uniref:LytR/AlgR family response regulator transcription factor n=1 Tax=Carboxylicivirga sp. M1479 TaxID=2594476 RepID=UPI00117771C7|nr:LytTR family DNA-binding domain-containing protein [Carboxylicivirga sp. M1479]TRX66409.1 LytTR family transcriptional regulator [Carboxylicivirga sp. M1479]